MINDIVARDSALDPKTISALNFRHNPHFKYKYDHYCIVKFAFSALTLLVGGGRKGIWPVKKS